MRKNSIYIIIIIVLVIALSIFVWQSITHTSELNRIRQNMITRVYFELKNISGSLYELIDNIENKTTDYETNQQILIILSQKFTGLDTILKWYATIFPPKGITRNDYNGGVYNFEFISSTLTNGKGIANDTPYSGIMADGSISENEVSYLTHLRDDIDVILDAMVSPSNPLQANLDLTSSRTDEILDTFFSKWSYNNEDSPYFLLADSGNIIWSDESGEALIGSWSSETGSVTHFYRDSTGKTEDDDGEYEFTWEIFNANEAAARNSVVRDYTRIVYGADGMGADDLVLSLSFPEFPYPADFPYFFDDRDTLSINTMNLGRAFSLKANISNRLEWITLTRINPD